MTHVNKMYNNLTGYGHVVQLVGVSSVGDVANMLPTCSLSGVLALNALYKSTFYLLTYLLTYLHYQTNKILDSTVMPVILKD